jgi:hypothetical protein
MELMCIVVCTGRVQCSAVQLLCTVAGFGLYRCMTESFKFTDKKFIVVGKFRVDLEDRTFICAQHDCTFICAQHDCTFICAQHDRTFICAPHDRTFLCAQHDRTFICAQHDCTFICAQHDCTFICAQHDCTFLCAQHDCTWFPSLQFGLATYYPISGTHNSDFRKYLHTFVHLSQFGFTVFLRNDFRFRKTGN